MVGPPTGTGAGVTVSLMTFTVTGMPGFQLRSVIIASIGTLGVVIGELSGTLVRSNMPTE